MLIPVIAITTGFIVFSPKFVYVSIAEYINNSTSVNITETIIPFKIFTALLLSTIALVSVISFIFIPSLLFINEVATLYLHLYLIWYY